MLTVISKDGTPIAYDKVGDGPALILVGGSFQYRSLDQRTAQLAGLLGNNFLTFHYDRRGSGDSCDTPPYAVEREIEDIEALITEAGGSAFVFGHSSEAVLALEAAQKTAGAITKLALYEPPFIVGNSRPSLPENYLAHLKELVEADRCGDAVDYFMTKVKGMPLEMVSALHQMDVWDEFTSVAHTLVYEGMLMGESQSGDPAPLEQWVSVKVPTLIADGGASPKWMHEATQALATVLPHAQNRTLPGQSHGVDPDVLAPVLVEFFKGQIYYKAGKEYYLS
jgi:pimeloyl-ACP methyl ester carboxylesterase